MPKSNLQKGFQPELAICPQKSEWKTESKSKQNPKLELGLESESRLKTDSELGLELELVAEWEVKSEPNFGSQKIQSEAFLGQNSKNPSLKHEYTKLFGKIVDNFWEAGYSSVNAFIFTLPIIVELSEGFSPLAVFTNIIIAPAISPITILNLISLTPFVGHIVIPLVVSIQSLIFMLIDFLKDFSITPISKFSMQEYVFYYAFWIFLAFLVNKRKLLKNR